MHAKTKPAVKKPGSTAVKLLATPHMYRTAHEKPLVNITSGHELKQQLLREVASGCYCPANGYTECQCRELTKLAEAWNSSDPNIWTRYLDFYISKVKTALDVKRETAYNMLETDFSCFLAWISKYIFPGEPWVNEAFGVSRAA